MPTPEFITIGAGALEMRDARTRSARVVTLEPQGWSRAEDRARADIRGLLPVGWTPLRELLDESSAH